LKENGEEMGDEEEMGRNEEK
jgi:hypothetical protein